MGPTTPSEPEPTAEAAPAPAARSRAVRAEALFLAAVGVAAVLLTVWALQLWRADLSAPFVYTGDGMSTAGFVKNLGEGNSMWRTPRLGAPGVSELYDFPAVAGFNVLVLRFLLLFMPAYPLGVNVFYLLAYPLSALFGAWALRRLGAGMIPAAVGGLLFAVMPYHFVRGQGHLFLSEYYLVPAALLLAIECAGASPPLFTARSSATSFFGRYPLAAIALCVAIASSDVYYGFFTALFVALGCAFGFARHRGRRHVFAAGVLLAVILATTVLNLAPSFVYRARNGANPMGLVRNPGQAEVYGLKLDQLLLPVDGHRVGKLASLKASYHAGMQRLGKWLDNEAVYASPLGVVASAGLLFLFGWAFVAFARGPDLSERGELLGRVGMLAVSSFVVATVGGISALIAFALPQIRAYNRISIWLAFLALAAVAFGLEWVRRRFGFAAMAVAAAAVLALGALDQVSPSFAPDYASLAARYRADKAFVAEVERELPKGAAVLQLPYMPFPEPGGPIERMGEYEHVMPYLLGEDLRWSFGAMKGRATDALVRSVSSLPPSQLAAGAREAGYRAVWVDTFGYADGGLSLRGELEAAGLRPELISADGRYLVYRL